MNLRIATPGVPQSTPGSGGMIKGLQHAASLGIRALEMEWVQRVPSNPEHMGLIRECATKLDITLTVHAPYFINLHAKEPEKLAASKKRIIDALSMAQLAGAVSVCVHAAFYLGDDPAFALDDVRRATDDILKQKQQLFPDVNLAYESMGKHTQFGTLDEVLSVGKEFDLYPCIDFAHLHARSNGQLNDPASFTAVLDRYEEVLGKKSLAAVHFHYSGIEYGPKGERHHLTFEEAGAGADYRGLLAVLKQRNVGGILVCESPAMEDDTMLLQQTYESL